MSQIATTIEQSKRLIAAGLDPESADMMWRNAALTYDFGTAREVVTAEPILYAFNAKSENSIPAWSLSRLIDIHRNFDYGPMDDGSAAVIDCLVRAICNEIKYETGRVREEFIVKRPLGQPQETEGA